MALLSELIEEIGNENVSVQALHICMVDAQYRNGESTIKFVTQAVGAMDLADNKKTALIVWVDVDKFNDALAKCRGDK